MWTIYKLLQVDGRWLLCKMPCLDSAIWDWVGLLTFKISIKWFDFWVGIFYDKKKNILYVCPLPMVVIEVRLKSRIFR